jgi:hypothetical protein
MSQKIADDKKLADPSAVIDRFRGALDQIREDVASFRGPFCGVHEHFGEQWFYDSSIKTLYYGSLSPRDENDVYSYERCWAIFRGTLFSIIEAKEAIYMVENSFEQTAYAEKEENE